MRHNAQTYRQLAGRWEDITGLWLEIDESGIVTRPKGSGGTRQEHISWLYVVSAGNWILELSMPNRTYGRAHWLGRLVLRLWWMWRLRRLKL